MNGVLVSQDELMSRPVSGKVWDTVLKVAKATLGTPNIADMNSSHDLRTVGCALAAVRLNDIGLKKKATDSLVRAIGTEDNIRWLEIGRNLGGYVVTADLLNITSGPVYDWLKSFMTRKLPDNNGAGLDTIKENAWSSGSNASAQMGWVHAALSVYLGDRDSLDWGWTAFRRYCGDRTSTWKMNSNNDAWQAIPNDVVGIQNVGAKSVDGINIDGAISNDMWRSNPKPVANLVWKDFGHYPWVGLNGAVLAAEIFYRQGYPAYEVGDKALLRAAAYLYQLSLKDVGWYEPGTRKDAKYLLNTRYGIHYPLTLPVGSNGLVGFTDYIIGQ